MSSSARQQLKYDDTNFDDLMKALTDNFNVLADEVQLLSDRKTILEHKLRFAHEQYQQLADKYAPGNPDISHTLAALQIPPDLHVQTPERATFVPLPSRRPTGSKQQTAEAIRDGRRASQRIAELRGWIPASDSGGVSSAGTHSTMRTSRRGTSPTTVLEQDFTVPGKASKLECPFTSMAIVAQPTDNNQLAVVGANNESDLGKAGTPLQISDPICAAMYSETHSSRPASASGSAKCPIRFLDQHSPEEIAKYFETHKHEIPRSHEVCVKRYQRNENDVRKLDAKYGNIVSMIQGLGAKHQPMLPVSGAEDEEAVSTEAERKANTRVENWAKAISSDGIDENEAVNSAENVEDDRDSRFDRPLKEIRVGESPSRPWGISVPYIETPVMEPEDFDRPVSPPPAPVLMPERPSGLSPATRPKGVCPFGHDAPKPKPTAVPTTGPRVPEVVADAEKVQASAPTFLQHEDLATSKAGPKMVFTGPVFIGYPVEQAMALMQAWQKGSGLGD